MGRARHADRLLVQAEREIIASTPDGQARPRADRNKTPLVGWHPPADDLAWLDAQVVARGGGRGARSAILTEALQMLRAHTEPGAPCGVWPGQGDGLGACPSHPDQAGDH